MCVVCVCVGDLELESESSGPEARCHPRIPAHDAPSPLPPATHGDIADIMIMVSAWPGFTLLILCRACRVPDWLPDLPGQCCHVVLPPSLLPCPFCIPESQSQSPPVLLRLIHWQQDPWSNYPRPRPLMHPISRPLSLDTVFGLGRWHHG